MRQAEPLPRTTGQGLGRVESGEWRVESGEWRVESGEWRVESGEWRVESGEWRVESGEWRVESGEWRVWGTGKRLMTKLSFIEGLRRDAQDALRVDQITLH